MNKYPKPLEFINENLPDHTAVFGDAKPDQLKVQVVVMHGGVYDVDHENSLLHDPSDRFEELQQRRANVTALLGTGLSLPQIAKTTGRSLTTTADDITRLTTALNMPESVTDRRPWLVGSAFRAGILAVRQSLKDTEKDGLIYSILEQKTQGLTDTAISQKLKCSARSRIARFRNRHDLPDTLSAISYGFLSENLTINNESPRREA